MISSLPQTFLSSNEKPIYIIFLDIDGVLFSDEDKHKAGKNPCQESLDYANKHEEFLRKNSNSYSNNYWNIINAHHFSKHALANLDDLIQRVEAVARPQIVVSSRWRKGHPVEELKEIYFGMHPFAKYIIDKTPDKIPGVSYHDKAEEIQYWLDQHSEIKHYVVLDDEGWRLQQCFQKRFIQINERRLLVKDDVERTLAADALTTSLCTVKVMA